MADLRSEIEARKSRIEELRKQREKLARNGLSVPQPTTSAQSSSIVSSSEPLVEIESPFYYARQVQTESVDLESSAHNDTSDSSKEHSLPLPVGESKNSDLFEREKTPKAFRVLEQPTFPPSLLAFVDDSWRAVARASSFPAVRDYARIYSSPSAVAAGGSLLRQTQRLAGASGLVAWSPHYDDLVLTRSSDPRRAAVWSLEAPDQPEFTLRSSTPITELLFSPHSPHAIYAGGANGQIMMWDLQNRTPTAGSRLDLLPQLRSCITNASVLKLLFVGPNLISLDEEGTLQVWSSDQLSRPQRTTLLDDRLRAVLPALKMTSGLVPTAMAITTPYENGFGIGQGTGICAIGSIQGQLFRLPALPCTLPKPLQWRHEAPVSCLAFRPTPLPSHDDSRRHGVLLASGGYDWCIRIWMVPNSESEEPVHLLSLKIDYAVSDLRWHPVVPSVLVSAGEKQIQVWNLDQSFVKPVYTSTRESETIERVALTSDRVGLATNRCVSVLDIADDAAWQGTDNWLARLHSRTDL